jgi:hypothetical protein
MLVVCILLLSAFPALAWDDELIAAANAFADNRASNAQRAMLLMRNYEVNLLAPRHHW